MPTLAQLITIIVLIVAVGTPLTILVKYALDFWHARYGWVDTMLKAVAALAAWFVLSWGMMIIAFFIFYSAAHSEYRRSHGGAPDPSGSDDPTAILLVLSVMYILAEGGLVYWTLRRSNA